MRSMVEGAAADAPPAVAPSTAFGDPLPRSAGED